MPKATWFALVGGLILMALLVSRAVSEERNGRIHGVVVDPVGAVIPNAVVRLDSQVGTKVGKTLTNRDGNFSIGHVSRGHYTLIVEHPGFLRDRRSLSLRAGQAKRVSIRLRLDPKPFEKLASGCDSKTQLPPDFWTLRPIRVKLQKNGCFGPCPVYTVSLDHDGVVVYEGHSNVAVVGSAQEQIPPLTVEKLLKRAWKLGFFQLCTEYETLLVDQEEVIIGVTVGGVDKTVRNYSGAAPEAFDELEREIRRAARADRLVGKIGRK